jgi:dipeptidyl aminopeptidase/acylaminoacyl peptidase
MRKVLVIGLCILSFAAKSQKKLRMTPVPKKPLTHDVYNGWKEISYKAITNDGKYAAFTINPQEGDGKVVFCNLETGKQDSVRRATEVTLSYDNQYSVFKIKPQLDTLKNLRRFKKKREDHPKDTLCIYSLSSFKHTKIADVRSFKLPEKKGGWVAFLMEPKKEESKSENKPAAKADTTKTSVKTKKIKKYSDENGFQLVLRNLDTGKDQVFGFVKEYYFARYGQGLLFSTTGNDSTIKPGIYWFDLQQQKLDTLYPGKTKHKWGGLTISEDGAHVAFIVDADTTKALKRFPKLYHWAKGEAMASVIADEQTSAMPKTWIINENSTPVFSKDGSKLFFGISMPPIQQDTLLLPEEVVNVEVWNWKDDYIYPQQNKQIENERKRAHLAVINLSDKKMTVLGNQAIPTIELGDEGNASIVLGRSDIPYRRFTNWDISGFQDLYILDVNTGAKKDVITKLKGDAILSPKANFLYWFSLPDTAWFVYSIKTEQIKKLTQGLNVRFADEEDDHPDYPSSYGVAGWTKDDKLMLVYDRYDIWALDPLNQLPAMNITKIGREQKIVFRYVKLDLDERFIDPGKEILLSAFNEITKETGYYKLSLPNRSITKLVMSGHRYAVPSKARNADRFIYTRENFSEFPDVWSADFTFSNPKKLSDANAQMKNYLWGSVEMVSWRSLDNVPLQGLLYKPENFDPKKKYPMIVYFYEKNSDNLYNHVVPAPIRSSVNYTYYVSNNYLVFVPDIVYKIGYPGESAHNCILPGVTSLIEKGFVDEKHIGIQGHSWGGYQIAYLITRTNLFTAAEAGAPVSNMISAYGGIRWESGMSRMFQYEKSQSRIGASLWESPIRYIENSPIFFADKVQTPLLMMHNDGDGAVPWYQGIEYFMALRRLGKPVWMLNYNNQGHGLTQRQDKTDFAIRLSQFFDHYLKGSPMPEWMKKGIPAIQKGINKGYSLD